jgi:hypothetical protein
VGQRWSSPSLSAFPLSIIVANWENMKGKYMKSYPFYELFG